METLSDIQNKPAYKAKTVCLIWLINQFKEWLIDLHQLSVVQREVGSFLSEKWWNNLVRRYFPNLKSKMPHDFSSLIKFLIILFFRAQLAKTQIMFN